MKNKNEIIRFQSVVEKDRIKNSESFRDLILDDVTKILTDYFECNEKPELEIMKTNGKYVVKIVLTATNLRPFGILPKNE